MSSIFYRCDGQKWHSGCQLMFWFKKRGTKSVNSHRWQGWRRQTEERSVAAQSALLVISQKLFGPTDNGGWFLSLKHVCYFRLFSIFEEQRKLIFKNSSESGTACSDQTVSNLCVSNSLWASFVCCCWFFIFFVWQERFKLWGWRKDCSNPADLFLIRTEPSLGVEKVSPSPRDKQTEEELHKVSPGWLCLSRKKNQNY